MSGTPAVTAVSLQPLPDVGIPSPPHSPQNHMGTATPDTQYAGIYTVKYTTGQNGCHTRTHRTICTT